MRLICPNCGAQYDVADDIFADEGRDVQCSNCSHTWYESGATPEPEVEIVQEAPAPAEPEEQEAETWGAEDYAAKPQSPPKTPAKRQELDSSIANILREEAAREATARSAEGAVKSQNDLGLESASNLPEDTTPEVERDVSPPDPVETALPNVAPAQTSRSGLLPNIDEINSSLRPESERGTGYAELEDVAVRKSNSFRNGFLGTLWFLAILAGLYVFAPKIIETVPAIDAPLRAYVETVDEGRLWLDAQMRSKLDQMNRGGKTSNASIIAPTPTVSDGTPAVEPVTQP